MKKEARSSTTVLLVDDDRQEYLLIGYLLSEVHGSDYRLVWCQDLDEALVQIEQKKCDVVLLDYHWGGSSIGLDFLNKARAKSSVVPIIVMSDEVEAEIDQQAIRAGASDYLIKSGINSQLLERAIRYALERKQIEDRLDHLAHYDHLTDLPNRMLFLDRLRQMIALSKRESMQFALMFIDLNDFKGINDTYGHDVGDKLLKEFSNRLSSAVRRSDTVARIGGDEFTVLLHNIGSAPQIMTLAQKIITETNKPYRIARSEFSVGCSIGIAVYPDAGDDEESLQRHADLAMYQAKQEVVSSYRFYSDVEDKGIKTQWDLHRDFYTGLKAKQFGVFYVPRVDLKTNRITAVEIAPYWKHPKKGMLHHHQFSSIIADKEMGRKLSEWLLKVGFYQFSQLPREQRVNLVFNLDFKQFSNPDLHNLLSALLDKYSLPGILIELDIQNLDVQKSLDGLEANMDNLQVKGVQFGLNGFGSEFCSLLHLQHLPVSTLKLDKRFVSTVHRNSNDARLLKAIIQFAHNIDKRVVADGGYSRAQLEMLVRMGCDECKGQGNLGVLSFKKLQVVLDSYIDQGLALLN